MAKGIRPVIHDFYVADEFYPSELLFMTIDEAVEMIAGACRASYDSRTYRAFVERWSLSEQVRRIRRECVGTGAAVSTSP